MKIRTISVMKGSPAWRATTKLTLFVVSKDEWDTKEDIGKSMKNALYCTYCSMPKGTSQAKAKSNSEKITPVVSSYACLKASVSQLLTQSVSQSLENVTRPAKTGHVGTNYILSHNK